MKSCIKPVFLVTTLLVGLVEGTTYSHCSYTHDNHVPQDDQQLERKKDCNENYEVALYPVDEASLSSSHALTASVCERRCANHSACSSWIFDKDTKICTLRGETVVGEHDAVTEDTSTGNTDVPIIRIYPPGVTPEAYARQWCSNERSIYSDCHWVDGATPNPTKDVLYSTESFPTGSVVLRYNPDDGDEIPEQEIE